MLNTLDETLKFIMVVGGNNICFLDLKMSIQNNRLETTVYSKPTDRHLYLEASSCHMKSINFYKWHNKRGCPPFM